MVLVSGPGAGGTSCLPLSGGAPLGPDGARRLAGLLGEARPSLLCSLDLRCVDVIIILHPSTTNAPTNMLLFTSLSCP